MQVLVSLSGWYLQMFVVPALDLHLGCGMEPHIVTISTSSVSLHNSEAENVPAEIGKMTLGPLVQGRPRLVTV